MWKTCIFSTNKIQVWGFKEKKVVFMPIYPRLFLITWPWLLLYRIFLYIFRTRYLRQRKAKNLKQIGLVLQKLSSLKLWSVKHGNFCSENWSVIRQKGKSQNVCFEKTKNAEFSEKRTFLTPCVYQGVRNVRFSENLAFFVFLKHPFWDSPIYLITNEL